MEGGMRYVIVQITPNNLGVCLEYYQADGAAYSFQRDIEDATLFLSASTAFMEMRQEKLEFCRVMAVHITTTTKYEVN